MKINENDDASIKQLVYSFMRISQLYKTVIGYMLKDSDLNQSGHMILMLLSSFETPPSQREISEYLEITPAAVAIAVKKLEASNLINRNVSSEDGRINEIHLSEKGREMLNEGNFLCTKINHLMMANVTAKEYETIFVVMDKIKKNLNAVIDNGYKGIVL